MLDLSDLNPAQREAVCTTQGPLLVLAGAGSGKTRVLTYRIAHLVHDEHVEPYQILAITFTNKAAGEMRDRLAKLTAGSGGGMWVATFHAMCVRILRAHGEKLGYTSNFTIYDDDDSKRLVKEIMREQGIGDDTIPLNAVRARISDAKNDLISASDFEDAAKNPYHKKIAAIYARLQERLLQNNAMDFDDLLVNVVELFHQFPDILKQYQERFSYIHVDEYQDTNKAQYEIVRLLARDHRNVMVVGDDDQSIYSWRGADIRNILEFESDYPEAHTVKLEENYRSTGHILEAANAVIAHNEMRKTKELFTSADDGEKVAVYLATNEHDEARYIAAQIERLSREGHRPLSDFAVFYRTNAQSRVLEDGFLRAGIPYRIVGGTRYFDRAEIRDVMAYLKVVVNPMDDISLKRIINTPRRGIGATTISRIEKAAFDEDVTFETALSKVAASEETRHQIAVALTDFVEMLATTRSLEGDLKDVVEIIIERSGLLAAYEHERTDEALSRAENIREFINVAAEFAQTHEDNDLFAFMEWLALRTDLDALSVADDSVTLMTVHTAKGLEYPVVFVAGLEESIFPHAMSLSESPDGIEEERRLAYVAITRARQQLFLTFAAMRRAFGNASSNPPSRFIGEIPDHLIERAGVGSAGFEGFGWEKRGDRSGIAGHGIDSDRSVFEPSQVFADDEGGRVYGGKVTGPLYGAAVRPAQVSEPMSFAAGDTILHKTFGKGKITEVEGDSLTVSFEGTAGIKTILAGYAPIVKSNT
ncbi:MAG: UvrD-helicase domain-containing protein [Actinomycetia bacterium]|nr:UvrD-helicase domain-containing protein [Actinomycetes bacterium]